METDKKFTSAYFPQWKTADPKIYPDIKDFRKQLLESQTPAETALWEQLKSNKLGVRFRRQHIVDGFIPDFICLSKRLIIEVDGEIHNFQKDRDKDRTHLLEQRGFRVIRFTNNQILDSIGIVLEEIKRQLDL